MFRHRAVAAILIATAWCLETREAHAADPVAAMRKQHAAEKSFLPANEQPKNEEPKEPKEPSKAGKNGLPLNAVYDDGFRLRSADKTTELRFVWGAQLDGRYPLGSSVVPPSFDIRRARLDLIATIRTKLFMRIGLAAEDSPYIRNAFADYTIAEALHVRLGQMKVPFSTEWGTFDHQVNFIERAYMQPITPFIDRGVLLWGKLPGAPLTYNLGAFAGAGLDGDAPRGDPDRGKEIVFRVFTQPFQNLSSPRPLRGLYLVAQGTWESASAATRRFETRGTPSPTFDSNIWRWKADQTLGTNGRETDLITANIDSKARVGAEVHYLQGPFTLSVEASTFRWSGVDVNHDLIQGSKRLLRERVLRGSGNIHTVSAWSSVFVTGERKLIDNFGWRQPNPNHALLGGDGWGALELLGRASVIDTSDDLFARAKVSGFGSGAPGLAPANLGHAPPGEGSQVDVSILDGARRMYEVTLGVSWTLAYAMRLQLNFVHTWVPAFRGGGIISGASSEIDDVTRRNIPVSSESLLAARVIFRI